MSVLAEGPGKYNRSAGDRMLMGYKSRPGKIQFVGKEGVGSPG